MSKKINLILSILVATSLNSVVASDNAIDEKRRQFEQISFFTPTLEEIKALRSVKQTLLDTTAAKNVDLSFMTFTAVQGIPELHEHLTQKVKLPGTHTVVFFDMDESLLTGSALSWIDSLQHFHKFQNKEPICQLLLQYGFSVLSEFKSWVGATVPTPDSRSNVQYSYHRTVLDKNIPGSLQALHDQGMNFYGLTARVTEEKSLLRTRENLEEARINLSELSDIKVTKEELPFFVGGQTFDNGVIFTSYLDDPNENGRKYGKDSAANTFLDVYIKKLLSRVGERPTTIHIVAVDDNRKIALQVASSESVQHLRELEKKYNVKIQMSFFQPYECVWLSPCYYWSALDTPFFDDGKVLFPSLDKEKVTFTALKQFLEIFGKPLEQPLSGPFKVDFGYKM